MKTTCRNSLAAICVIAIGCGSDNGAATSVSGKASAGPIASGTVSIYAIEDDGDRGALLGSASTSSDGSYTISLSSRPSGPVEVVITGGSYAEESTGATITLGSREISALLAGIDQDSELVAITPLTHLAYGRYKALEDDYANLTASDVALLIARANAEIAAAAGVPDIVGVLPADPAAAGDPASNEAKYALFLAGISELATDSGGNSLSVLDSLYTDVIDGDFDGGSWAQIDDKILEWVNSGDNVGGYLPTAIPTPMATPTIDSTAYPMPSPSPTGTTGVSGGSGM